MSGSGPRRPSREPGVVAVEFALVATLLFMLLFAGIEIGRLLWSWNAAVEATRFGARLAVVCDTGSSSQSMVMDKMIRRLPALSSANIVISYLAPPAPVNSCTAASCTAVNVALTGYTFRTNIPFLPLSLTLPAFATTLRRESMNSIDNEVCQ